jgi:DNA-binding IclR family transcriptional regulator
MSEESSARLVQSTLTSLRILEVVREQQNARLTDVVDELGIGYSTAHNHLETLREEEWLLREDGEYRLSMKFLHFGRLTRRKMPFFQIVRRYTNDLARRTNLEVEFLIEEYGHLVSLIDIIPANSVYGNVDDEWQGVGIFYNMTNTASGKAILAELPEERVESIIDTHGFAAQTQYSVQSRDVLSEQLEAVRQQGYARAHQEVHEGF